MRRLRTDAGDAATVDADADADVDAAKGHAEDREGKVGNVWRGIGAKAAPVAYLANARLRRCDKGRAAVAAGTSDEAAVDEEEEEEEDEKDEAGAALTRAERGRLDT